jgi:hypothetical protein
MNVQCYLIIRVHGKYCNGIDVFIFWNEPCWKNGLNIKFVDGFNYKHVYFNYSIKFQLVLWTCFMEEIQLLIMFN